MDEIEDWAGDVEDVFSDDVKEVGNYINDLLYGSDLSDREIAGMAIDHFFDIEFGFTFYRQVDKYLNPHRHGEFLRSAYNYIEDGDPVLTDWEEDEGIEISKFATRCGIFTFGIE